MEKLRIWVFLKRFHKVALSKVEHICFLHLVAYLYLYNSLIFIFQISDSFSEKMKINFKNIIFFEKSPWTKHKIFELKEVNDKELSKYKILRKKKRNVLASKLRPVKTSKGEKMLLSRKEGNSTTAERHGWSFI